MKNWLYKIKEQIQHFKYRKKLNIVLVLVGLLPILLIGGYMWCGFRTLLMEKEYEALEVALNQSCLSMEKQTEIFENLANYLVFDLDLQDVLLAEQTADYDSFSKYSEVVDPVLGAPKFYHESIERVTIYSEKIRIPHDTTLAPLSEISGMGWFPGLSDSQKSLWVWPDEEHKDILLIRKFPGQELKDVYLGIYCDLGKLMESLQYFEKKESGILLLDEQGNVLLSKLEAGMKAGEKVSQGMGDGYWYVEKRIGSLPLRAYVFTRESAVYSGFYDMLSKILVVIFASITLILVVSRYTSRVLVKRIEMLTSCVDNIELENMKIELEDNTHDEIGVLIRSFHRMQDRLQRLIRQVYESKIKQQNLEMQALQAQINPHFLYNTLSLINWKAIGAGEEDISTITLALSDFYRTTLNKGENFTTVKGELTNVKSYLKIQLMMHDYDFETEYLVDEEVGTCRMPKLILQPLVENALEHGIDLKEEGERRITISCQQDTQDILWIVQDTGVGMDEAAVRNLLRMKTRGYGVRNVNDRLILLYGQNYELHIESYPGEGTRVKVRIPKRQDGMIKGVEDYV